MKTFNAIITWNNTDTQEVSVMEENISSFENWLKYYVGANGTYEIV